ncbi:MAG: hypothetical protein ABF651_05110 [Sporolactobacillus sp.]
MSIAQIYGRFAYRFGRSFRTSAYIQWGSSARSLGAVLMLNPGSASQPALENHLEKYGAAMGMIEPDLTLKHLAELVDQFYDHQPSGRLHIYNLFQLRATKSGKAVSDFEDLVNAGKLDPSESLISTDELKLHPWLLIGWGVGHSSPNLQKAKTLWMRQIDNAGIPVFGKKRKDGDYSHLCPLLTADRQALAAELYDQFRTKIKPLIPFAALTCRRYSLLKWNQKLGIDAQFILKNNEDGTQCLCSQGQKLVWFHLDLAQDAAVHHWQSIDNLSADDRDELICTFTKQQLSR